MTLPIGIVYVVVALIFSKCIQKQRPRTQWTTYCSGGWLVAISYDQEWTRSNSVWRVYMQRIYLQDPKSRRSLWKLDGSIQLWRIFRQWQLPIKNLRRKLSTTKHLRSVGSGKPPVSGVGEIPTKARFTAWNIAKIQLCWDSRRLCQPMSSPAPWLFGPIRLLKALWQIHSCCFWWSTWQQQNNSVHILYK